MLRIPHFLDNRLIDGGEVTFLPLLTQRFMALISVRCCVNSRGKIQLEDGVSNLKKK
jgi:hypothetical protein